MAKQWIAVAVLCLCLAEASAVRAQEGGEGPAMFPGYGVPPYGPGPGGPVMGGPGMGGPGPDCGCPVGAPPAVFHPPASPTNCTYHQSGDVPCFWVSAEPLFWWIKNSTIPAAIVTTDTNHAATPAIAGSLGSPTTTVLLGRGSNLDNIDFGTFIGGRATIGAFFDEDASIGFEASGFLLENRSFHFLAGSGPKGDPVLARPFFDYVTGAQGAFQVANPNILGVGYTGQSAATATSQLWGAEVNGISNVISSGGWRVDVFAGFRYLRLDESFAENDTISSINGAPVVFPNFGTLLPGGALTKNDEFNTRNQIFTGQLGTHVNMYFEHWFVAATGKIAAGDNYEVLGVQGNSQINNQGQIMSSSGGVLAVQSNIGTRNHDVFVVVPEGQLSIGYQFCHTTLAVNYTYLYLSRVARAANQIPNGVNSTFIPGHPNFDQAGGAGLPTPLANQSSFSAQGLSVVLGFVF